MKTTSTLLVIAALAMAPSAASAAGCLKGAAVGCVAGHHHAAKKAKAHA